jgi:uncharacterized membrane protein
MMPPDSHPDACPLCGRALLGTELLHGEMVRPTIRELIRKDHPTWTADSVVCFACLNRFRAEYIEDVLEAEKGELSALDREVLRTMREHETLSENLNVEFDRNLTFGQRLADRVAEFGGSWTFILCFAGVMAIWILVNAGALLVGPFDPFPYILLNLVLSCLAAVQAPVIMMSQNRQEAKDRLRAEHDYQINLKAELEIRHLNWRMDQLINHQWHRLLEIQQIQTELIAELARVRIDAGKVLQSQEGKDPAP